MAVLKSLKIAKNSDILTVRPSVSIYLKGSFDVIGIVEKEIIFEVVESPTKA